jgi:hypothetical protein
MPANLWKSLTVRFMALGHSLHEAESMATVIVTGCLAISTIMGYRSGDAERERLPAFLSRPKTRPMIGAGHCGTVQESVDRDGILLHCQPDPAGPGGCGKYDGIPGERRTSSAAPGTAAMVRW